MDARVRAYVCVRAHVCVQAMCVCVRIRVCVRRVHACVYCRVRACIVYVRACVYGCVRTFVRVVYLCVCVRVRVRAYACEGIEDALPLGVLPSQKRVSLPSCLSPLGALRGGLGGLPGLSQFSG